MKYSQQQLQLRIQQSREHFTHYSYIFGNPQITGIPILDEYLCTTLQTMVLAIIFYYTVTSLQYLICFKIWKKKFTPEIENRREYQQQIWFDLKWSFLNIIGQSPLVAILKMGYPYFSKVQYQWNFTPILIVYLLLHIIYDQFLTYWTHRILHYPPIYRALHSIHHKSKSVTPFSGFAFHPLDAFSQAVPVFTSCYFLPIPLDIVIAHGLITSVWAVSIHDNMNMIPFKGILFAGSHSIHHFPWGENYNYGKITSVCDRLYGSYCDPEGITGYGYQPNQYIQKICDKLNSIYTKIVPDNGKQRVQQDSRKFIVKARKLMTENKKNI